MRPEATDRRWLSGGLSQLHDGQFPVVVHEGEDQFQLDATSAFDRGRRLGKRRSFGPAFPRLIPRCLVGRRVAFVEFQRSSPFQRLMRAERIVPLNERRHLRPHVMTVIGDGDLTKIGVFEGSDKSLNNCDAALLSHGTVAWLSAPSALTPGFECRVCELWPLVTDQVFGSCADLLDSAVQEFPHLTPRRVLILILKEAVHGCSRQVQSRPREELGNLPLAQFRTRGLESLDHMEPPACDGRAGWSG